MKRILIAVLFLSALSVAGQEVKKIIKVNSRNPSFIEKAEYYVLADAKKVKHGLCKRWINDMLLVEGYYKHNKKDSTWIRYGSHQNPLIIMQYSNDKKAGIWEYYLPTGELDQKYDYSKKELVYFKPEENGINHQIIKGKDTLYTELSRPPINIGGYYKYFETVARNLRYPITAFNKTGVGRIYVSFIVDENGKTSHFKVVKKGDNRLDTEAIRLIGLIENWLPALKGGVPVKVIHTVPILFTNDQIIEP